MEKILRIKMGTLEVTFENLPDSWRLIGGRGLIAKILNKEVSPKCDPLGPENIFIVAIGLLSGTNAPSCGRTSVGGKSPLTKGIKEANAGGPFAQKLDRLGIRCIIVEGYPKDDKMYYVIIDKAGVTINPANEFSGLKNYPLVNELRKRHGEKISILSIGPAGEMKLNSASVALTDNQGVPSRQAARGGLGAVMGSRGLKAIVIDDTGAPAVKVKNRETFNKAIKNWVDVLKKDMNLAMLSQMGTPAVVGLLNAQGTMPALNYTSSGFEEAYKLGGEVIADFVSERGGSMHACMPGCVIGCSIIYNDANGKYITSAYEYETIAMLGTNLGISDPDAVARMNRMCNEIGIDTIEVGSALGVAVAAGKMKFGDANRASELLEAIGDGTEMGRILGQGVVATAKAFNIDRIPAFKGQAIPAHDPRGTKGTGVTYCTSPMGADHTAGVTYSNPQSKDGQIEKSLRAQVLSASIDTIGYCLLALPLKPYLVYDFLAEAISARYGVNLTKDEVVNIGRETLREELAFNKAAGFNEIHERYPQFIREEILPPSNCVFDIEDSEIDTLWDNLLIIKEEKVPDSFRIYLPSSILVGPDVVYQAGKMVKRQGGNRVLIVTDPGIVKLGIALKLVKILKDTGLETIQFSEVEPDPSIEVIEKGARIYEEAGCDCLIPIGGGSSIDTAKGIAVKISQGGNLRKYDLMRGGIRLIKPPLPLLMAIPTTSGTGSEVTSGAVVTDKRRKNRKFVIVHPELTPKIALLDPKLTMTMPSKLTAITGIDALSHCIEGYPSKFVPYQPLADAAALQGVRLAGRSLKKACLQGNNIGARLDMCMVAYFGGLSVAKGSGLSHAIGHALSAWYHIPHGLSLAVSLLCYVRINRQKCEAEFHELAQMLDGTDDLEMALRRLYADIGMPLRFRDVGVKKEDIDPLVEDILKEPANYSNPVRLEKKPLIKLMNEFY
ncbi:MAG: iron-containing alcohol dehydrogenase [Candidatus Helarchaeota archaeon]|nr:iron-containing alcohol dehydrogenase [Candidatus Helarchaeota archaeon]